MNFIDKDKFATLGYPLHSRVSWVVEDLGDDDVTRVSYIDNLALLVIELKDNEGNQFCAELRREELQAILSKIMFDNPKLISELESKAIEESKDE